MGLLTMRAGKMDRRITIRGTTLVPDGYGGWIEGGVTDIATVWASAQQQGGREFIAADQVQSERRVVFRLRYRSDLDTTNTVLFEGTEFNIREVRELGRRAGLELHCTS